jgi:hypothetical protein
MTGIPIYHRCPGSELQFYPSREINVRTIRLRKFPSILIVWIAFSLKEIGFCDVCPNLLLLTGNVEIKMNLMGSAAYTRSSPMQCPSRLYWRVPAQNVSMAVSAACGGGKEETEGQGTSASFVSDSGIASFGSGFLTEIHVCNCYSLCQSSFPNQLTLLE